MAFLQAEVAIACFENLYLRCAKYLRFPDQMKHYRNRFAVSQLSQASSADPWSSVVTMSHLNIAMARIIVTDHPTYNV